VFDRWYLGSVFSDQLLVVARHAANTSEQKEALQADVAQWELDRCLTFGATEKELRPVFCDIYTRCAIGYVDASRTSTAELLAALRREVAKGNLLVVRVRRPEDHASAPQVPAVQEQPARVATTRPKSSFIIELETDDGWPVPAARYEATFSDGDVRTGELGTDGRAKLEGVSPGPVIVRYPDLDDTVAKSLAASARRALDRQDYGPIYELLKRSPETIRAAIESYDLYLNDYTGGGFAQDLDDLFTDPDAHRVVGTLLARAGVTFGEPAEQFDWREQDGGRR
jgi:hypothetical protein